MSTGLRAEILMASAWLLFPMLPVLFEETYFGLFNLNLLGTSSAGPEPRDWGWGTWLMMLGPLLGYGFLAGSTAEVPDDVTGPKQGLRRVVARRAVWVAIGPWWGFLFVLAVFLGVASVSSCLPQQQPGRDPLESWKDTWVVAIVSWLWTAIFVGIVAYGWLWPAWAAIRRAGPDRALAVRAVSRDPHGPGVRRLALRQLLGDHIRLAELLLRRAYDAADPGGAGIGDHERLLVDDHLRRDAAARAVPRDAARLGVRTGLVWRWSSRRRRKGPR